MIGSLVVDKNSSILLRRNMMQEVSVEPRRMLLDRLHVWLSCLMYVPYLSK